jgi:hypothetical protein
MPKCQLDISRYISKFGLRNTLHVKVFRVKSAIIRLNDSNNGVIGGRIQMLDEVNDRGDFQSWCQAYVERVPLAEARGVPYFAIAARAYAVWWSLVPGRTPCRQDLDPCSFGAALLPHLTLIDAIFGVGEGNLDYRWRLCGEEANRVIGTRLVGNRLSTIERQLGDAVYFRWALDDLFESREPTFYVLRHRTMSGCAKRTYGVLLPLSDGNESRAGRERPVRHVLGAFDWLSDS